MKNYKKYLIIVLGLFTLACDSENVEPSIESSDFDFNSLAEGEAQIIVTGSIETSFSGTGMLETNGSGTNNPDSDNAYDYYSATYRIENDLDFNGVVITVYWPENDGPTLPEGELPVQQANLTNFPQTPFVDVLISIDGDDTYGTPINDVDGSFVTIQNVSEDYLQMDMEMDVKNLETFFGDDSINLTGGAKFRP